MPLLLRALTWIENTILAAGIALATALISLQVALRYGFGYGIAWAEELSVYAIIWVSFMAASAALRADAHLTVDVRALLLRGRALALVARLALVISAAFGIALCVFGIELVRRAASFEQLSPALQAPMWVVYLIVPVAGAFLALRCIERLIRGEAVTPAADAG